uniref:Uncharacterized protein n=1 Tax=Anguilla anguilla TaxID=7936 RepID=A0A0E9TQ56_ANGAN
MGLSIHLGYSVVNISRVSMLMQWSCLHRHRNVEPVRKSGT